MKMRIKPSIVDVIEDDGMWLELSTMTYYDKDSLEPIDEHGVDLENYISNKLRELGADLINHMPYSFNRGLNVGKTNAYNDILNRLNARKEESK